MSIIPAKTVPPVDELDLTGVLVRADYTDDARFQKVLADAHRQLGPDNIYSANALGHHSRLSIAMSFLHG